MHLRRLMQARRLRSQPCTITLQSQDHVATLKSLQTAKMQPLSKARAEFTSRIQAPCRVELSFLVTPKRALLD